MAIILPDYSPRVSPRDEVFDRVAERLRARLAGEWDVVGDAQLQVCRDLAMEAISGLRLAMSPGVELVWAAERNIPKGGIMLPGAEKVVLWNAMIDVILSGVKQPDCAESIMTGV